MIGRNKDKQRESMMKKTTTRLIKFMAVIVLGLIVSMPSVANESMTFLTWSISFPNGNTKDFSQDSSSFRGVTAEFRYFVGPQFSIGIYGAWHVFNGSSEEMIAIDQEDFKGDVSGTQFRYINAWPVMVNAHFYTGNPGGTRLFIGAGAGLIGIEERVDIGVVAFQGTKWHFGVAPEIGASIPIDYNLSLIVSGKYHYAFSSGDRLSAESATHSYISLNIGLSFNTDLL
jgi:opacity protein-like surface antigen